MNAELSKWLEEVIDLQRQVVAKYKECPVEGIDVCSSCLDTHVQFFEGLRKLAEELGLELQVEQNCFGTGKDRLFVNYPNIQLIQVEYRGEADLNDGGAGKES